MQASNTQFEILGKKTPEISTINRGTGSKENGIMIFETVILLVLEYFGVEWTELQIRDSAEMAYSEYYWLHIAELKHFMIKMKQGEYKREELGKLTPIQLMTWLRKYANESLRLRSENYIMESYSNSADARAEETVRQWQKDDAEPEMRVMVERIKQQYKDKQSKTDIA